MSDGAARASFGISAGCFDGAVPYLAVASTEWETQQLSWFGERVRQARHAAGLGQRAVAERSGVSQSTISRLERGKVAHLPLVRLLALAHASGRSLPVGACPHDHSCL